ncbi:MAG: Rne/Rng family ribonuclease [Candidatus Omnitrophica bacterium]|nr:Rne/Rng family ribonuclease [Candidatus Omnitrophota bacterium]
MKKEILVNNEFNSKKVAVIEDGRLEEFYVERESDKQLVGSIFKGKVSSIVPGIGAAFIDIGLEKNGFLYVTDVVGQGTGLEAEEAVYVENGDKPHTTPPPGRRDRHEPIPHIQDVLKKEQEVLVQVVKEPFGTKGARLTCQISLAGRFVVFMPYHPHVGISKRIDDRKERERIRQIIKSIALPKEAGLIVRTAASGCDPKVLERDIRFLIHQWRLIQRRHATQKAPAVVHEEYGLVLRMVRDVLTESFDRLVVNDREEFKRVDRFMRAAVPNLRPKLTLYTGDSSLFAAHGVQREIDKIYEPRATLKSGGHIVIEQTEALVAIDVNTGKFTGTRNLEETAYRTNCEAAREIAKQIRLRDLGGIIIIDFIDMDQHDHRRSVLKILEEAVKRDRAKTSVLNLSQLGLVEMTRQRMRRSLEGASTQKCPYCQGRGIVKSKETVASEALLKLSQTLKPVRREHFELTAFPDVIEVLSRDSSRAVRSIENQTQNRVSLVADAHMHVEEVRVKRILDRRKKLW